MAERAAPRVLPADADAVALEEERREREVLGRAPVERPCPAMARSRRCSRILQRLGVRRGSPRAASSSLSSASSSCSLGNAVGTSGTLGVGAAAVRRPDAAHRLGHRAGSRPCAPPRARASSVARRSCGDGVGLLARDVAGRDEARDVDLAHRRLLVDERVHERLREARLVALVVAVLAVAVHVDDDVLLEALAELHREARHLDDGLRDPRRSRGRPGPAASRDVGAVARGARVLGAVVKPIWLLTTRWIVPPVV